MPVLLITDLDGKHCPPEMIVDWLPVPRSPRLLFRIAVRETESWVLADRTAFSRFIGVSVVAMPTAPDELPDPKAALLKLVRKSSKRELKRDILPPRGPLHRSGSGTIVNFVTLFAPTGVVIGQRNTPLVCRERCSTFESQPCPATLSLCFR